MVTKISSPPIISARFKGNATPKQVREIRELVAEHFPHIMRGSVTPERCFVRNADWQPPAYCPVLLRPVVRMLRDIAGVLTVGLFDLSYDRVTFHLTSGLPDAYMQNTRESRIVGTGHDRKLLEVIYVPIDPE